MSTKTSNQFLQVYVSSPKNIHQYYDNNTITNEGVNPYSRNSNNRNNNNNNNNSVYYDDGFINDSPIFDIGLLHKSQKEKEEAESLFYKSSRNNVISDNNNNSTLTLKIEDIEENFLSHIL